MSLNKKKAVTLLTPSRKPSVPTIPENADEGDFVVIDADACADIRSRDPSPTLSDDGAVLPGPTGNMPVNTYQLRGAIASYQESLECLENCFETAMEVVRNELRLVEAVEDLVMGQPGPGDTTEPVGYDSQYAGLFVGFMYGRLYGRIWKMFVASVDIDKVNSQRMSPVVLLKILMKLARLALIMVLQITDRRCYSSVDRLFPSMASENAKNRTSDYQNVAAYFRDMQTDPLPRVLVGSSWSHHRTPSAAPGSTGSDPGTLKEQISCHYNKFLSLILGARGEFETYLLPPDIRLAVCTPTHPRPSVIFRNNLRVVEDAVWHRYSSEHAHSDHHSRLMAHMRLGKGGVKKARQAYGMTEQVAKELFLVYDGVSDMQDDMVKVLKQEVEDQMHSMLEKMHSQCCAKPFHCQLVSASD